MNRTVYVVVGIIAVVVGIAQLYQAIYDRPSGASVSTYGIVLGMAFVALGIWFSLRRSRTN